MTELAGIVGASLSLMLLIFVGLLLCGANFAPDWAKSRGFLVAVSALVLIGSNSFH